MTAKVNTWRKKKKKKRRCVNILINNIDCVCRLLTQRHNTKEEGDESEKRFAVSVKFKAFAEQQNKPDG
jgi:hypothetical protein